MNSKPSFSAKGNFIGNGKGSHRRKGAMPQDEYAKRYERIFGAKPMPHGDREQSSQSK